MSVQPSELGRFRPVAENLVLAGTVRAQLHDDHAALVRVADA
jgi:hypothetical protein